MKCDGDRRDLLTPKELAPEAKVSKWTLLRWAARGEDPLPSFRPSRRTILISRTAFLTWLARQNRELDLERIADEAVNDVRRKGHGA